MNEDGARFLQVLPSDEEERVTVFRALLKSSATLDQARNTVIEVYRLASSGLWPVNSIHDIQMFMTAIEENTSLLPIVESDIEGMLRHTIGGGSFRATWSYLRKKFKQQAEVKAVGLQAVNQDHGV